MDDLNQRCIRQSSSRFSRAHRVFFIAKMAGTTGLWTCAPDADSFAELAGVCLPGDIPVLDPVSGSWTCGLDNDTVTTSLPWSSITGIPADIADGDQDTVTLTLPWSSVTGVPTEIADGDQDSLGALSCSDGEGASWNQSTQSWECAPEATELDPVFAASTAAGITPAQVTNWDMAHGWGDHAAQGYVTSTSESDPVFTGSEASGITAANTTNWNTAVSWGDHSTQGYISSEVDPSFSASEAASITASQTSQWNTAYSWGDHATQGYSTSDTLASLNCSSGQVPLWNGTAWGCGDDQDTDTQLTEAQVDTMVANNGYLSPDASGNVVIGNAPSSSPLTVDGTIESTAGGVKFPDGTTQTTAATAAGSASQFAGLLYFVGTGYGWSRTATCQPGDRAISGGCTARYNAPNQTALGACRPQSTNAWYCLGAGDQCTATVLCLDLTP